MQFDAPFDGHPLLDRRISPSWTASRNLLSRNRATGRRPFPATAPGRTRPGLITGASDDDTSGIATYSQVGAAYGYALSWTLLFSYPLMVAIQLISARIGRTTGHGIAGVLKLHYPNWLLQWVVALLLIANIINLGADLGAMADAMALQLPGPKWLYVLFFSVACIAMQLLLQYTRYVAGTEVVHPVAVRLLRSPGCCACRLLRLGSQMVVPHISWTPAYLVAVVAVFGTTISPVPVLLAIGRGRWRT